MSTGVAPHKVRELEQRALRAENENLRTKVQALATHSARLLLTIEEHRTSMALVIAACGNRVELKPELLDQIDVSRYELKTDQDDSTGAVIITLVERQPEPEQPNVDAPAVSASPALVLVPR